MSNASMLMLDEPSMGLSPLLVQEIFDIIQNIHKEGMTILLVEQNAQTVSYTHLDVYKRQCVHAPQGF